MPGSFFWILFAFYKRLFQRCHQVWVTTYQRRHKNMKNMSDVYDTIRSWCIWWCLLSASVWLTSKEWVLLWFYDFGNAIKEPCSSSINKDSDYLLSLVSALVSHSVKFMTPVSEKVNPKERSQCLTKY